MKGANFLNSKDTSWLDWGIKGDSEYARYDGHAGQVDVVTSPSMESGREGSKEMCGMGLLHISRDGRPLWFNGWIRTAKRQENDLTNLPDIQRFVTDPRKSAKDDYHCQDGWKVQEGNVVCLVGDGHTSL